MIIGSHKFYCPFKDCSAMLLDDGAEEVRESECPNCKRLFCAQCKRRSKNVPGKEDIMMEKLAFKKHWRKCPWCGIYVERTGGCTSIRCRCGTYFSFHCGRMGCTYCGNSKRRRDGRSIGFFVFLEEYKRNHRDELFTKDTAKHVLETYRSMSRSEKKPYEMVPSRILIKPIKPT
ncbi:hypothetical protein ACLB2K_027633 [Fragaria x ananassa]